MDDVTTSQGITIDRARHRVTADGNPIHLTRSEFRLLQALIRQPGRVFQRSELIDAALGEDTLVMERTIDVHGPSAASWASTRKSSKLSAAPATASATRKRSLNWPTIRKLPVKRNGDFNLASRAGQKRH